MGRSQLSSVQSPTSKNLTSARTNFLAAFLQTSNQLSCSIPSDLANCSRSYLSPDRNNRMGEIPVKVSQGEQLHEFFLQQNAFQGTIPSGLRNLTPLQNLDLENNKLNGSIPGTLGILTNLRPSMSLRTICRASFQQLLPQGLTLVHLSKIHSCVAPHLRVHRRSVIIT
jgi:hypothetical protein